MPKYNKGHHIFLCNNQQRYLNPSLHGYVYFLIKCTSLQSVYIEIREVFNINLNSMKTMISPCMFTVKDIHVPKCKYCCHAINCTSISMLRIIISDKVEKIVLGLLTTRQSYRSIQKAVKDIGLSVVVFCEL